MALSDIKAVVSDMDGVLWRGDVLLPGMLELFAFLRHSNIPFVLATNNSGRHPEEYVRKLDKLGIPGVEQWQIATSGTATADYMKTRFPEGSRIYVIGNPGLPQVLEEAGFILSEEDAVAVVVGIDFEFNYQKARRATLMIRNQGAALIGTNPDLTFPSPEGLVPGAGSLVGMLRIATDVEPVIIGKPARAMFDVALARLGTNATDTLMIGDRLNTDIEGAHHAGMKTAFVLTGVNKRDDIDGIQPDYIFEGLPELIQSWQQTLAK